MSCAGWIRVLGIAALRSLQLRHFSALQLGRGCSSTLRSGPAHNPAIRARCTYRVRPSATCTAVNHRTGSTLCACCQTAYTDNQPLTRKDRQNSQPVARGCGLIKRRLGGHGGHMKHMSAPGMPVRARPGSLCKPAQLAIDAAKCPRKDAKYCGMLRTILRTVLPLNDRQRFGGCCLGYSCLADPSPDIPARPHIAVGNSRPRRGRRNRGRGGPAGSNTALCQKPVCLLGTAV